MLRLGPSAHFRAFVYRDLCYRSWLALRTEQVPSNRCVHRMAVAMGLASRSNPRCALITAIFADTGEAAGLGAREPSTGGTANSRGGAQQWGIAAPAHREPFLTAEREQRHHLLQ